MRTRFSTNLRAWATDRGDGCSGDSERWSVERPEQVIDVLALMVDAVDNIPGVPGSEKRRQLSLSASAAAWINLLGAHRGLTGRVKENLKPTASRHCFPGVW